MRLDLTKWGQEAGFARRLQQPASLQSSLEVAKALPDYAFSILDYWASSHKGNDYAVR